MDQRMMHVAVHPILGHPAEKDSRYSLVKLNEERLKQGDGFCIATVQIARGEPLNADEIKRLATALRQRPLVDCKVLDGDEWRLDPGNLLVFSTLGIKSELMREEFGAQLTACLHKTFGAQIHLNYKEW